ncbi:TonB-dependent outer membrane receptor [Gluconobacter thailandicus F149-1 = NBRC 100600]|uniref:TonB-dependent outer membrane receptor n=1 Tax=Gluconobacter thailandicus NBRC 3257 TaxID=1381097 RepID=A0ABQ0IVL4_GLUTH|nr:TonB-dependent receptor [Gluconobacter thailandicus]KXV53932.1 TonB-dependent receptor [Gluconobacter thailandicus]GAC88893.1 TonB-dependent outer membrane receptor [Gluconobacter thailandicus NBRC 3255]GAD26236.1 TonB-dependent outer membrane receptor [Gluconobacter thailandicus NBRC 3257]GAN92546.1 TonB-dependent outer membrane receptor [Gluconobacter thailandicus F149-1 = NBRC 100600]GEL87308.1 TonB-dependent receptor [Gluconobacter thailandicus F149-1 = NBRC 100600]
MTTSVPGHVHVKSARKPSAAFLKIALLAGISYTALPLSEARADATTKHHSVSHKGAAKKTTATHTGTPAITAQPSAKGSAVATKVTPSPAQKVAQSALQQAPSSAPETVTVTGTRLSQTRLTNVMAGTRLDAKQLAARGYTNLGLALLRENPAFSTPSNSPIGSQGKFGAGQTFMALFNLGEQRTLTLVNGMRMVGGSTASIFGSSTGSQVDVGTIPVSLIKNIDTKYGGAGAAYGADAVAGVVNFELDDHFTGVDFNAQGNWTQNLDAPQEKITFKAGTEFDHHKGGVVFDVEYRNSGGMVGNDRPNLTGEYSDWYRRTPVGSSSPYSYVVTPNSRYIQSSVTGIPMTSADYGTMPLRNGRANVALSSPTGNGMMFSQDGRSLVPITYNQALKGNYYATGGNGLSLANYKQLYTPSDSLNLTTLGHYDFTDHLHATWQGWYQRGSASSTVAQGTWSDSGFDDPVSLASYTSDSIVNGAYTVSTNNPYLSPEVRSQIRSALVAAGQSPDTFYMNRLNQDLDGGMFKTTNQMFRFQGGLNGDFEAVGRRFNWKVQGEYSKYMNDTWQPSIVTQNLMNALNATTDGNGNIVCATPYNSAPIATRSSTCSPINLFGYNQMTPAARDYVIADAHQKNSNAQRDLQAEINSTIVKLPAGNVRWDIGYEHRRESYNFDPGSFSRGWLQDDGSYKRYGNSIPITPVSGAYHTHEVYGELDIPLVSPNMNVPGIYNLSATANGRFINNSITGNYWTYMFGGAWWPTQDFGLSGNYAQSVRNPSVTELFSPNGQLYSSAHDPCSQEYVNSGPNPAIRAANCAKAGIPSGFESTIVNQTMPGTHGGNTSLKNETSKSFTGTLELHPHFVPGFDLTASFIDIKIKNEITDLSVGDLMSACYDSASYNPNDAYCQSFQRGSDHQITDFHSGYYNIANQHMQALQANLSYYLPLRRVGLPSSAGNLELRGTYIHYVRNEQTYLGSTYMQVGDLANPDNQFTLSLNYTRGPLFVQWQTVYYGKSKYALQVADTTYQHNSRPDFAYFNTTIGYKITKNFDANFMINNITEALPKYPGTIMNQGSLNRYYDAMLGRSFQLSLGVHF